jgi:glyoxylase-like metal-dependent hydrolase (beta-lactamase superfamily II)
MKMHFLAGGLLRMRKSVYLPEADRTETIDLPVSSVLLRHAQGNVLFDTGCHPSALADPQARWGTLAKAMQPVGDPGQHVLSGLAEVGLEPTDIDVVVNSHFHPDHCGCNGFFKRATVICHRHELTAAQGADAEQRGYLPADWDHPMPTRTIEAEHDVFGDGRLLLVPLPGHTPGTIGALATLERAGRFLMAADAVALRPNLEREVIPRNTWNTDLALNSLREIRKLEDDGAQIIFGHDMTQWTQLHKGPQAYE